MFSNLLASLIVIRWLLAAVSLGASAALVLSASTDLLILKGQTGPIHNAALLSSIFLLP